jgi:glycosyltransferase involved in cell wall biosynthesis
MNNQDAANGATDNICCVIPAYNEEKTISEVVGGCRRHVRSVTVVDDGSSDGTVAAAIDAGAHLIGHKNNMGKGFALRSGFSNALSVGFGAVITLDADGQHDTEDIPRFISAHLDNPEDMIVGARSWSTENVPLNRYLANRFGTFVISRIAGHDIPDTQSGFRLYTADAIRLPVRSSGFETESEILIRASRAGIGIRSIPIKAIYPKAHRSHFRPLRDFMKISIAVAKTALEG